MNPARNKTAVYILQYSVEKGVIKDIYGIYANPLRAKIAMRQLATKLLPTNLEIANESANEIFLRHKKFDTVYHLFIERKEVE